MAAINTDFLRFSANSMKELITRKLTEDSKFTDLVYEGSNLAILIDIISYMYQCLVYLLNSAASESMFADTLLYDNIVRLVKFIGYLPRGCSASSILSYIDITSSTSEYRSKILLPYSYIETDLTDANGNKIGFSTVKNNNSNSLGITLSDTNNKPVQLYNGKWKLYSTIFTASGIDHETFVLEDLQSDSENAKYVAQDFIDVYVASVENGVLKFTSDLWKMDKNGIFTGYESNNSSLFNNDTIFKSLYPGDDQIYTVYLNLDKSYELKFGNGIVGKKLNPGDKVYVFYLETNGPDGYIDVSDIDASKLSFKHSPLMFGISQDLYDEIFLINDDYSNYVTGTNDSSWYTISFSSTTSTKPTNELTVDEIREDAPLWFSTGNRLVTKFDYEYYLKNARNSSSFGCDIVDVKCMNNWTYLATFYKWLYDLGENGKLVKYKDYLERTDITASSLRYLKKSVMTRYDYYYADSADANNVYLWIKSSQDFDVSTMTATMNNVLNPIKLITAELIVCKAMNMYFDICAAPEEYVLKYYMDLLNDDLFDAEGESYIEITMDDNALAIPSSLLKNVCDIILSEFDINKCKLGLNIKYDDILNKIYEINGVSRVRTIFISSDSAVKNRVYDGLSFASWTTGAGIIEAGDDLNVSNTVRQLEDFLFPVFYNSDALINKIKIIKKSLSTVNTIKF